jgi:hypothetical protein
VAEIVVIEDNDGKHLALLEDPDPIESILIVAEAGVAGPRGVGLPVVFNRDGPAQVKQGKTPYYFPFATTIYGVSAAMGPGLPPIGSDLTFDLLVNGVVVESFTIPDGAEYMPEVTLNVPLEIGDYITVDITATGSTSAGSNLTIYIRYT